MDVQFTEFAWAVVFGLIGLFCLAFLRVLALHVGRRLAVYEIARTAANIRLEYLKRIQRTKEPREASFEFVDEQESPEVIEAEAVEL